VLAGPRKRERKIEQMHDDQRRALTLAREAFDLWQQGHLPAAAESYRECLPLLDLDDYSTPDIYGEYSAILAAQGQHEEARAHAQRHLEIDFRQNPDNASPAVAVARHFLAERCLQCEDPISALDAVAPSLGTAGRLEGILRVVQAAALVRLGKRDEAVAAAHAGVAASTSEKQRHNITERLREVLGDHW
jgi:tetratricopeptide (TPR) repeat protein